jgi:hypothetical protein
MLYQFLNRKVAVPLPNLDSLFILDSHEATRGVLRRGTRGVHVEVHEMLSVTDRTEEVNLHLRSNTENAGAGTSVESDDVAVGDDEEHHDQVK